MAEAPAKATGPGRKRKKEDKAEADAKKKEEAKEAATKTAAAAQQSSEKEKERQEKAKKVANTPPLPRFSFQQEITQLMQLHSDGVPELEARQLMEDVARKQMCLLIASMWENAQRRGGRTVALEDIAFVCRHNPMALAKVRRVVAARSARDKKEAADDERARRSAAVQWVWEGLRGLCDGIAVDLPPALDPGQRQSGEEDGSAGGGTGAVGGGAGGGGGSQAAESRGPSFTVKKMKRFRDWLRLGDGADVRLHDDLIEVLGVYTFDTVVALTRSSQDIKLQASASAERDTPGVKAVHVREAYRRFCHPPHAACAFGRGDLPPRAAIIVCMPEASL